MNKSYVTKYAVWFALLATNLISGCTGDRLDHENYVTLYRVENEHGVSIPRLLVQAEGDPQKLFVKGKFEGGYDATKTNEYKRFSTDKEFLNLLKKYPDSIEMTVNNESFTWKYTPTSHPQKDVPGFDTILMANKKVSLLVPRVGYSKDDKMLQEEKLKLVSEADIARTIYIESHICSKAFFGEFDKLVDEEARLVKDLHHDNAKITPETTLVNGLKHKRFKFKMVGSQNKVKLAEMTYVLINDERYFVISASSNEQGGSYNDTIFLDASKIADSIQPN